VTVPLTRAAKPSVLPLVERFLDAVSGTDHNGDLRWDVL
jgi:hypothetical protein